MVVIAGLDGTSCGQTTAASAQEAPTVLPAPPPLPRLPPSVTAGGPAQPAARTCGPPEVSLCASPYAPAAAVPRSGISTASIETAGSTKVTADGAVPNPPTENAS